MDSPLVIFQVEGSSRPWILRFVDKISRNRQTRQQHFYGNKLTFKVQRNDEYWVISHLRSLLKGDTSYDTHVTDWINWDSDEYKYHLYQVQIDRIEGMAVIMRSKKPYKEGKAKYKLVPLDEYGMQCKKSGLSGKF